MRDKCNTSGGLRGLCGLVAREDVVAVFFQIAVARREGRFWGKRVGSGRPSATGFWWVKCGKSRGLGGSCEGWGWEQFVGGGGGENNRRVGRE